MKLTRFLVPYIPTVQETQRMLDTIGDLLASIHAGHVLIMFAVYGLIKLMRMKGTE